MLRRVSPSLKASVARRLPARVLDRYVARTTDVFLVSYPKTGRTWLRLMIGRALELHFGLPEGQAMDVTRLSFVNPSIPRIRVTHDGNPHRKSPGQLLFDSKKYRSSRVIFLVRDPRDVIVSLYFQARKRVGEYEGELHDFIHEPAGGFDTIVRYYNLWAENRHVPKGFLLVRYEDLHRRTEAELARVLDFMGLSDVDDATVGEGVAYASFDRMRKMELEDRFGSDKLRPGDRSDLESFKTRKGQVGGFVDYLQPEQIQGLGRTMEEKLSELFSYPG